MISIPDVNKVSGTSGVTLGEIYKPRFHGDDRRCGWFNIFPYIIKDVNIVRIPRAGTIVAWHRHFKQSDFWFVPQGGLQVGLAAYNAEERQVEDSTFVFLTPEYGKVLMISPPIWHGYKSLEDNTVLLYGLTNSYTGEDELRASLEDMGINWELGAR